MKPDNRIPPGKGEEGAPRENDSAGKPEADARDDPQQQRENRDRLNVGEDHRTPEMERGKRGTFP